MVCKSTDGLEVLQQIRHVSSKEKIPPLNSSGVERKWVKGEQGFLLAEKWVDKVFDVLRISDRIILIRLVIGKVLLTFLSVYAPQAGLQEAEKDRIYDQLQSVLARIPASEVLIPLGDWNGHIGDDSNGFEKVHHGKGFGVRNVEGERLLEFALANDLVVENTCFRKRVSNLVTYSSSNHSTQIDYIIFRKSFRKAVNDVKVIPTEECIQQHNLLICDFTVCIPSAKKCKFTHHICTWKLRDPAVSKDFQDTFKDKVAALAAVESADDVEDMWSKLKTPLLQTASDVCGLSKKHQWKRETWWWDDKVEAVKKKQKCFKRHLALAKACQTRVAEDTKVAYNEAKRVVWQAKSVVEREKFSNIAPNDTGIFKLAKQTKQIKMLSGRNVLEMTLVNCLSVMRRKWRLGLNTMLDYWTLSLSGRATCFRRSLLWKVHHHQSWRILFAKPLER